MKVTPINIPGKRRRVNDAAKIAPHKRLKVRLDSSRQKSRKKKDYPSLQGLPLEILEDIFYLSGNVNLPRSSPAIGRLLSGEFIRRDFFILAFAPVWNAWLREHGNQSDDEYYPDEADPELQSTLLEESWTDITFILMCLDRFIEKVAKRRVANGQPFDMKFRRLWRDPDDTETVNGEDYIPPEKESDCFWQDYASFRRVEELDLGNFVSYASESTHSIGLGNLQYLQHVHEAIRIPDSLFFKAASDEGALQKLFWLARGGAGLSREQTWEVTLPAFRHFVPGTFPRFGRANLTAVRVFSLLGAFYTWPDHVMQEEIRRLDPSPECPSENLNANSLKSRYVACTFSAERVSLYALEMLTKPCGQHRRWYDKSSSRMMGSLADNEDNEDDEGNEGV
ncbi:hypothetical protein F5Y06DRAFT_299572 [Hypoxylon sp. FL0890]|nr:hypothetical protein F5Y06DRAFT_299572 [Hypoxylon sp. FL0890]